MPCAATSTRPRARGGGGCCEAIARVNEEANLNIQLVLDEPRAFTGFKARLVNFTNVRNTWRLWGLSARSSTALLGG